MGSYEPNEEVIGWFETVMSKGSGKEIEAARQAVGARQYGMSFLVDGMRNRAGRFKGLHNALVKVYENIQKQRILDIFKHPGYDVPVNWVDFIVNSVSNTPVHRETIEKVLEGCVEDGYLREQGGFYKGTDKIPDFRSDESALGSPELCLVGETGTLLGRVASLLPSILESVDDANYSEKFEVEDDPTVDLKNVREGGLVVTTTEALKELAQKAKDVGYQWGHFEGRGGRV